MIKIRSEMIFHLPDVKREATKHADKIRMSDSVLSYLGCIWIDSQVT